MEIGSLVGQKFKKSVEELTVVDNVYVVVAVDIGASSRSQDDILVDIPSLENVHKLDYLLQKKKDPLPPENFGVLDGFSHLKFATNPTSPKFVVVKWVTFKFVLTI